MTAIPESILEGCLKQERGAQEQLYRHCYPSFLRFCLRYADGPADAADILNKAFFNILTRFEQFQGKGDVLGWMKRIVLNAAIDYVRANRRFRQNVAIETIADLTNSSGADDHLAEQDILALLRDLPLTASAVFNLFVIEGYSHREIGELLGISEANSKWYLHYARKFLQKKLQPAVAL